uniref:Lipid desaturase domain-containing protein n=1 Tax=Ditylum brightwellii TaxID=49249 RepID=A0A6U3VEP9_9STRA|mmetsp:Transcript_7822/g.11670  ORF Transcript_7822/g.11670 Transcript_7822/m.11670 type:complete len:370 (+) Transcript_7822:193-1302(+)
MKFSTALSALALIAASTPSNAFAPTTSLSLGKAQSHRAQRIGLQMSADSNDMVKVSSTALKSSTLDSATAERSTVDIQQQAEEELLNAFEIEQQKSYLDDGFVFGLEGSGLERPKGKVANVVVEGDNLETQPYQVAMVGGTFLGHAAFASLAISQILQQNGGDVATTAVQTLLVTLSSWVLADLGSGILHWSVDNYGNGRTPIMGNIIAAFQGHHSAPWTITQREFGNNVHKLCIPFGIPTMALISTLAGPENGSVTLFFTVFCALEILSQEFHKWSHMTKKEVPSWVNSLMDIGLTIGRVPHAQHHIAPYDGNYCIVSGLCNKSLDESGFFRRLEHIVYNLNGIESNAWKLDAKLRARTLRGEYRLEN